jgi:hypothetical protein
VPTNAPKRHGFEPHSAVVTMTDERGAGYGTEYAVFMWSVNLSRPLITSVLESEPLKQIFKAEIRRAAFRQAPASTRLAPRWPLVTFK